MKNKFKKVLFPFLLLLFSFSLFPQNKTNERAQWFTDARFGMSIHWGVYSGAEGFWKGKKLRNDNDYAEWIMYRNRIEKEEYLTLLDRFNWEQIDPEEWGILAKKSGMKYGRKKKSLIGNISLNGNFMLNIGPRANGNVPFEISQRMLEMGKWLDVNGESIYGAEAFDLHNVG